MLASPRGEARFPCIVQPKLDGIRCVVRGGLAMSRKLEAIPNRAIAALLSQPVFEGLDGELIAGPATCKDVYHNTESVVMSRFADPSTVVFYVFDDFTDPTQPYSARLDNALARVGRRDPLRVVESWIADDETDLAELEEWFHAQGYEGAMVRDPEGPYKYGRATEREGWLWKMKRFQDDEMRVIRVEERMHNGNDDVRSATGKAKRGHSKAGLTPTGTLGALVGVSEKWPGEEIRVGSSNLPRLPLEEAKRFFVGQLVTFKHQPAGAKNKPRFPVYKGIRHEADLS